MSFKTTFFLLLANLILIGAIFFVRHQQNLTSSDPSMMIHAHQIDFNQIEGIEIKSHLLASARVLRKQNREWSIVSPIDWPANPFAVQRILTHLEFLESDLSFPITEMVRSGQTLADYGLEDPTLILTLRSQDRYWDFALADPYPNENRLYLLGPQKDRVWIISKSLLNSLLIDIEDLRRPQLISIPPFEVQGMTLQIKQPTHLKTRLVKIGDDWRFESPIQTDADDPLVMATLSQICALPILQFLENSETSVLLSGLDTPWMRLTLDGFHRRETLLIGHEIIQANQTRSYYATLEGTNALFTLPAQPIDALRIVEGNLRQRYFLKIDDQYLNAIEIKDSHAESMVDLERLETGIWQLKQKDGRFIEADQPRIEALIEMMNHLKVVDFIYNAPLQEDLERLGLVNPELVLDFKANDTQTLLIGKPASADTVYAKLAQEPFTYTISSDILKKIDLFPHFYRTHWINLLPKTIPLKAFKLIDLSRNQVIVEKSFDSPETAATDWQNWKQSLSEKQQQAMDIFLQDMFHFRVKSFLKDPYQPQGLPSEKQLLPWQYQLIWTGFPKQDGTVDCASIFVASWPNAVDQAGGCAQLGLNFLFTQNWVDALNAWIDPLSQDFGQPKIKK